MQRSLVLLVTVAALAGGCALDRRAIVEVDGHLASDAGGPVDAAADAEIDSGLDAEIDGGLDADVDAGTDAGRDGGNYPEVFGADYDVVVHGGTVRLEGVLFTMVTGVRIGGIVQTSRVISDAVLEVGPIAGSTPVGDQSVALYGPAPAVLDAFTLRVVHLNLSEIDAITDEGTDTHQFVELAVDSGGMPASLAGYHIVLFGGTDDRSYAAFELGITATSDRLVLGSGALSPSAAITLPDDVLGRDGVDAVAIYQGPLAIGSAPSTTGLIDAVVHSAAGGSDSGLTGTLLLGGAAARVLNEGTTDARSQSIQWCSGARRDARGWVIAGPPTPGAPNACP